MEAGETNWLFCTPNQHLLLRAQRRAHTWAGVRSKSKATGRSEAQPQTTSGLRGSRAILRLEGPPSLLGRKAQKCGQTF